ncbi:MAG: HRDC domain-containing protein, partial [Gammaproteobacteria bacterium]|nr:HRDC domain-containing protein [Gammaproteobacteria bacterium]
SSMPYKDDALSVEWIASDTALSRVVNGWDTRIGIDTEFQRTDTFYPIPGLYQVISGDRIFLIDPMKISRWQPLVELLEDPGVVKIMHACSEDLELMSHHLDAAPAAIFDTQLANAFQSRDFSTSYANLVLQQLDVALGKHQTRSNWLRRPLSEDQIRYAGEDVHYLPLLFECLSTRLRDLGRTEWFQEVMTDRGRFVSGDPESYYRSVKNAWKLDIPQLNVLQCLCAWRERKAMSEDVPRSRVVWDEHLYGFAKIPRLSHEDVRGVLPRPVARKYTEQLLEQHRMGAGNEKALELPTRPLTQGQGAITKTLRGVARELAEQLEFAQELIARKREVEACVRHYFATGQLSPAYLGWRAPLLADEFNSLLQKLR